MSYIVNVNSPIGNDTSHVFISDTCIPPPPVYGCTNDDYVEYDPLATIDDSSCATLKIYGCTDSTMFPSHDLVPTQPLPTKSCSINVYLHESMSSIVLARES